MKNRVVFLLSLVLALAAMARRCPAQTGPARLPDIVLI
jgi:hypothetical protein